MRHDRRVTDQPGNELPEWRLPDVDQAQLCQLGAGSPKRRRLGLRESWGGSFRQPHGLSEMFMQPSLARPESSGGPDMPQSWLAVRASFIAVTKPGPLRPVIVIGSGQHDQRHSGKKFSRFPARS